MMRSAACGIVMVYHFADGQSMLVRLTELLGVQPTLSGVLDYMISRHGSVTEISTPDLPPARDGSLPDTLPPGNLG